MTDTVNKQALLERAKELGGDKTLTDTDRLRLLVGETAMGRYDTPPTTPVQGVFEQNDAMIMQAARHVGVLSSPVQGYREALEDRQRLRDALLRIKQFYCKDITDTYQPDFDPEEAEVLQHAYNTLLRIPPQALSQTDIQPSVMDNVKTAWDAITLMHMDRYAYSPYRQGFIDALTAAGIYMTGLNHPGINSTEDDQPGPKVSKT